MTIMFIKDPTDIINGWAEHTAQQYSCDQTGILPCGPAAQVCEQLWLQCKLPHQLLIDMFDIRQAIVDP